MPSHQNEEKEYVFPLLLFACSSIIATQAVAQSSSPLTQEQNDRIHSLKVSSDAQEARSQEMTDKENLSDLKADKSETKIKAKEARRIEKEASDSGLESRTAYAIR